VLVSLVGATMFWPGMSVEAQTSSCRFVLGFAALRELVGAQKVGDCLEDEHFNLENGNSEQRTTGGLLVWRKIDNFTAFTDGGTTWINGPNGLQSRPNSERFSWERDPVQTGGPTAAASPQPAPAARPAATSTPPPSASPSVQGQAAAAEQERNSTASNVIADLRNRGAPITDQAVVAEEGDQHQVGRPKGLRTKSNFRDDRLSVQKANSVDVQDGGSIEVFEAMADAEARRDDVTAIGGDPAQKTYVVVAGTVLLQLSNRFTPDQAAEYEAVLKDIRLAPQVQKGLRFSASAAAPSIQTTPTPATVSAGRAQPDSATTCPPDYPIKGNKSSSGDLIYHVPGGQLYERTEPEACFATEADARSAGYRASQR